MQINGKLNADIVAFGIKRNKSHDGREAHVDLDISVKQDDASSRFGKDFADLAFATLRTVVAADDDEEGGDKLGFLMDKIKPGQNVVYERHVVELTTGEGEEKATHEISAQPELLTISTVDGEARVVARFRMPVDTQKVALVSALTQCVGKTIKCNFNPTQGKFGFAANAGANGGNGAKKPTVKRGAKADAEETAGAEAH